MDVTDNQKNEGAFFFGWSESILPLNQYVLLQGNSYGIYTNEIHVWEGCFTCQQVLFLSIYSWDIHGPFITAQLCLAGVETCFFFCFRKVTHFRSCLSPSLQTNEFISLSLCSLLLSECSLSVHAHCRTTDWLLELFLPLSICNLLYRGLHKADN